MKLLEKITFFYGITFVLRISLLRLLFQSYTVSENLCPKNSSGKKLTSKAGPIIRCECGFKILLVPDLKAMARAIEAHAAEHAKKEKIPAKAAFEDARIQLLLTAQVLDRAATS